MPTILNAFKATRPNRKSIRRLAGVWLLAAAWCLGGTRNAHADDQKRFGEWKLGCKSAFGRNAPGECAISQDVQSSDSSDRFLIAIFVHGVGSDPELRLVVQNGIYTKSGVHVLFDGKHKQTVDIERCDDSGCFARTVVKPDTLNAWKSAQKVAFVIQTAELSGYSLFIDADGFSKAYDALLQSQKPRGAMLASENNDTLPLPLNLLDSDTTAGQRASADYGSYPRSLAILVSERAKGWVAKPRCGLSPLIIFRIENNTLSGGRDEFKGFLKRLVECKVGIDLTIGYVDSKQQETAFSGLIRREKILDRVQLRSDSIAFARALVEAGFAPQNLNIWDPAAAHAISYSSAHLQHR